MAVYTPCLNPVANTTSLPVTMQKLVNFDAECFDLAADNCASKTCTPFLSDLYEARPFQGSLTGVGTADISHIGKAQYVYRDDEGTLIEVDDHDILVCRSLTQRLLSVPNWATQMEKRGEPRTSITSYSDRSILRHGRSTKTILHCLPQKNSCLMCPIRSGHSLHSIDDTQLLLDSITYRRRCRN